MEFPLFPLFILLYHEIYDLQMVYQILANLWSISSCFYYKRQLCRPLIRWNWPNVPLLLHQGESIISTGWAELFHKQMGTLCSMITPRRMPTQSELIVFIGKTMVNPQQMEWFKVLHLCAHWQMFLYSYLRENSTAISDRLQSGAKSSRSIGSGLSLLSFEVFVSIEYVLWT